MTVASEAQIANSDRYVTLAGGLVLPLEAIQLALELERAEFRITREGSTLLVEPHDRLTLAHCRRIRRWKWHLLAMLDSVTPEV